MIRATTVIAPIVMLWSSIALSHAGDARRLSFDGSVLVQVENGAAETTYRSNDDADFVQTLVVRDTADTNFGAAVGALVARAKTESHGAKLKMLEKPDGREMIIVYLADKSKDTVVFRAERLFAGADTKRFMTMAYSAEFEPGNISDDQERKVKSSAVAALASFDTSQLRPPERSP